MLVAIGARFDDRVISVPSHFLAQPKKSFTSTSTCRRSPSAWKVDIPIVGNVKDVLIEMILAGEGWSQSAFDLCPRHSTR